jgi:uncharacterized membrane protein
MLSTFIQIYLRASSAVFRLLAQKLSFNLWLLVFSYFFEIFHLAHFSFLTKCWCFEPLTSKFVFARLTRWCARRTQGIILIRAECPYVQ